MDEEEFINNYFKWVISQAFATEQKQMMYIGVLKLLFKIPFYYTNVSDSNRAGDASVFRHYERGQLKSKGNKINKDWLDKWENAMPSVLEVLVGICERWRQFYEYETQYYFSQLFHNLGLHIYRGEGLRLSQEEEIRRIIDRWMTRQIGPNGEGSPFPLNPDRFNPDMRHLDIWSQMNTYALEHFR